MCFKNLPIEFDEQGNARLKEGVADPYSYTVTELRPLAGPGADEEKLQQLLARNGHIRQVDFDPVTRVAGALAFHTVVDLENRRVLETDSMATLFRGYEVILKGRDPRDAIFISSRACGVCGGVHSTCSSRSSTSTTTRCTSSCSPDRTSPSPPCARPIPSSGSARRAPPRPAGS